MKQQQNLVTFICDHGHTVVLNRERLLEFYRGEIPAWQVSPVFNGDTCHCTKCEAREHKQRINNHCPVCGTLISHNAKHCTKHAKKGRSASLNPVIGYRTVKSKIVFVSGGASGTGKR